MFYNGIMQLICIDGQGKDEATFVNICNNELIKAYGVKWEGDNVSWNYGNYYGSVAKYIKINEKEER